MISMNRRKVLVFNDAAHVSFAFDGYFHEWGWQSDILCGLEEMAGEE